MNKCQWNFTGPFVKDQFVSNFLLLCYSTVHEVITQKCHTSWLQNAGLPVGRCVEILLLYTVHTDKGGVRLVASTFQNPFNLQKYMNLGFLWESYYWATLGRDSTKNQHTPICTKISWIIRAFGHWPSSGLIVWNHGIWSPRMKDLHIKQFELQFTETAMKQNNTKQWKHSNK